MSLTSVLHNVLSIKGKKKKKKKSLTEAPVWDDRVEKKTKKKNKKKKKDYIPIMRRHETSFKDVVSYHWYFYATENGALLIYSHYYTNSRFF